MNTQIETTEQRIVRILASDSVSDEARNYIQHLVENYGLEEATALDHNDCIGLSVFENDDGEQFLHYGDYGDSGRGYVDAAYCNIEDILDAAEGADDIPSWWPEESTVILVECQWNGYGERYLTKGLAQ